MTIGYKANEVVEKQAAEMMERAVAGARGGTFTVTHLGPRFEAALVNFLTSSAKAEESYVQFRRASMSFASRPDDAALAMLEAHVKQMDELLAKAGLSQQDTRSLRRLMWGHRISIRKLDKGGKALSEKLEAARVESLRHIQRVGRMIAKTEADIEADLLSSRLRIGVLGMVADLSHAGRVLTASEEKFSIAYRKLSRLLGVDLENGWKRATDYLVKNAGAVKLYRQELERLSGYIAKETDPATLARLQKAYEWTRKRGVHNKLKGLLGELYADRWADWQLMKSGYQDLAEQLAGKLGKEWSVLPVSGGMYLGPDEIWDEAILLVREGTGGQEAMLFMAGQVKVALVPDALNQTLNDITREALSTNLRVVLADGTERLFLLKPMPQGEKSYRWVLNAVGGGFPESHIAALQAKGVKVEQITMPISVDEFNLIADWLLKACADFL